MLSIYKRQKNLKTTLKELKEVIYHLDECGVHIDYAVAEQHGHYNKLHCHAMVRYKGRYSSHTKYGNIEFDGYDFKIHWTPIKDYVGCMRYLEKSNNHIVLKE